jgi:hypothetical protein
MNAEDRWEGEGEKRPGKNALHTWRGGRRSRQGPMTWWRRSGITRAWQEGVARRGAAATRFSCYSLYLSLPFGSIFPLRPPSPSFPTPEQFPSRLAFPSRVRLVPTFSFRVRLLSYTWRLKSTEPSYSSPSGRYGDAVSLWRTSQAHFIALVNDLGSRGATAV